MYGSYSFAVQARVSSTEHKKQADLDREHAERDKEQTRAGQLLARVQLQIAEIIDPATISVTAGSASWVYMSYAVGLHMDTLSITRLNVLQSKPENVARNPRVPAPSNA